MELTKKDCYGKPELYKPEDFEGSKFPLNTLMVTHEQEYKCLDCDLFEGCKAEVEEKFYLKKPCGPYHSKAKFDPTDIECLRCTEMGECRTLRQNKDNIQSFTEGLALYPQEQELRRYRRIKL
jgi:hypothetical protein